MRIGHRGKNVKRRVFSIAFHNRFRSLATDGVWLGASPFFSPHRADICPKHHSGGKNFWLVRQGALSEGADGN